MIARSLSPCLAWLVLVLAPLEHTQAKLPADLKKQITAIQAVGAEGSGNAEAAVAFRSLSQARASALLPLLRAIEPSNRIARNWLRSAVEVIVERELAEKKPLPFADLKTFLSDRTQAPEARRLAFDLMLAIDRGTSETLIPGFLDDPSTGLRREAEALMIAEGAKLDRDPRALIVDASGINDLDATGAEMLRELLPDLADRGVEVHLSDLKGPVRDVLIRSGIWDVLEGRLHASTHDAVRCVTGTQCPDTDPRRAGIDERPPQRPPRSSHHSTSERTTS